MPMVYQGEQFEQLMKWTVQQRADYINTGGVKGHIMDMRFIGGYRYEPMLLLRYVGRKSGKTMIISLGYTQFGGEIVIVGSKGGADEHPQWVHNIRAGKSLAFQIATQSFNATWREPKDVQEREEIWTYVIKGNPLFKAYRANTKREIPLFLLNPLEEIPVFKE